MTEPEVVATHERRPLEGRTVVVTRPREQARSFSRALADHGAAVVEFPTIRIGPTPEPERLEEALRSLDGYDWVVFTSVNGVRRTLEAMERLGLQARVLSTSRVAAIGPGTAARLQRRGVDVDVVPGEYRAEALAAAILDEMEPDGARILLPRAAGAREVLAATLREAGAELDEIAAYRTERVAEDPASMREMLHAGRVDWLTFTASSTVRSFAELVGREQGDARVAVIGPITAGTARERGFRVDAVADEYTIPGLVDALVRHETDEGEGA